MTEVAVGIAGSGKDGDGDSGGGGDGNIEELDSFFFVALKGPNHLSSALDE